MKKSKKPFSETGFGKFVKKIGKSVPELAGDVIEIITSGNPLVTGIDIIKEKLNLEVKSLNISAEKKAEIQLMLADLEKNRREWEKEIFQLEIEDKDSARDLYKEKSNMANKIARMVINWNLVIIGVLVAGEVACIMYMREHPELLALISSVVGGVVQALISERSTVVQFFFGSSIGSKKKQDHIENDKL